MLDIKLIRENPEVIKASQRKRGESTEIVDECSRYDVLWREALQKGDELKHKRNVKRKRSRRCAPLSQRSMIMIRKFKSIKKIERNC
jgi:seryl-tRNA synthetase